MLTSLPSRRAGGGLVAALLVLAVGCQEQGHERIPVSGEVLLDGQPLSVGTITFIPQGAGAATSGDITDGKFNIPQEQGPSPGKCRIEVLSYQKTGKKVESMGSLVDEKAQVLPAKYNTHTQLEETLVAGQPVRLELTSK